MTTCCYSYEITEIVVSEEWGMDCVNANISCLHNGHNELQLHIISILSTTESIDQCIAYDKHGDKQVSTREDEMKR